MPGACAQEAEERQGARGRVREESVGEESVGLKLKDKRVKSKKFGRALCARRGLECTTIMHSNRREL